MQKHSANYRGILAMIGGCGCFSANDAATKIAAAYLPVTEIMAIRAVFALLFALLIIAARREFARIFTITNPWLHLRALIESVTGVLIIFALARMPIANVTAILLVQPFLLTVVGAAALGEAVGWRRWSAVAAGFVGMLLVVKPATEAFDNTSLVVLVAAFFVLARDLLTRKIPGEVPTTVITFATALVGVPVGLAGALIEPWTMPDRYSLALVAVSGAFLVFAFLLMVIAFRGTDVSAVSPFRYSIVVFAVIFGIALFAEIPDGASFAGILLIVAAGLYMLHRETIRRKRHEIVASAATEPPH